MIYGMRYNRFYWNSPENKNPEILLISLGFGIFQIGLDYVLVEAAGVEPASENNPHRPLHAYPGF